MAKHGHVRVPTIYKITSPSGKAYVVHLLPKLVSCKAMERESEILVVRKAQNRAPRQQKLS